MSVQKNYVGSGRKMSLLYVDDVREDQVKIDPQLQEGNRSERQERIRRTKGGTSPPKDNEGKRGEKGAPSLFISCLVDPKAGMRRDPPCEVLQ
jgi:hypothetical protein